MNGIEQFIWFTTILSFVALGAMFLHDTVVYGEPPEPEEEKNKNTIVDSYNRIIVGEEQR